MAICRTHQTPMYPLRTKTIGELSLYHLHITQAVMTAYITSRDPESRTTPTSLHNL